MSPYVLKTLKRLRTSLLVAILLLPTGACADSKNVLIPPTPTLQRLPPATCPTVRTDRNYDFNGAGPGIGSTAIDFALKSTTGQMTTLSKLLAEKPVILIFGSFT